MSAERFTYIDLFCGIGGFHQAMSHFGGKCVFACDIDEDCRKVYEENYGLKPHGDITQIDERDIPEHDVLCAGFPCQSFSKAGHRLGFEDKTRGTLFFDIARIVSFRKPKFIILENVRNLASHDKGKTWETIRETLTSLGYVVNQEPTIFSPHYMGIPQHRERVYILCVRKDSDVEGLNQKEIEAVVNSFKETISENRLKKESQKILQRDEEIENLNDYKLSTDVEDLLNLWNEFVGNVRWIDNNAEEILPSFPIWSEFLRVRNEDDDTTLVDFPDWKKRIVEKNFRLYESNRAFIDEWLVRAKRNPLFFGAKAKLEWQAGQKSDELPSIWANMIQFRPSGIRVKKGTYYPALVAMNQTSIVGPRKRKLTPRECARLQSFPDEFILDKNDSRAYKQLGNSVNVDVVILFADILFSNYFKSEYANW